MIKFEHSVFALPFALPARCWHFATAVSIRRGIWRKLAWIVVAMVGARSAAMAFNRLLDADIDARNPRTRSAPSARRTALAAASPGASWRCAAALFFLAAGELNPLCLRLAPAGPGNYVLLFLHQAVHFFFASGAGLQPGHRAGGRLDRRARVARSAHSLAHRRRHLLDRRLRHHLRLPGFRIRFRRGACGASRARWASPRALRWRSCCTC